MVCIYGYSDILQDVHKLSGSGQNDYYDNNFSRWQTNQRKQRSEVITGINVFKDIGEGLRNIFGGRSQGYEEELAIARAEALQEMEARAQQLGANAVVGVKMDCEVLGTDNGMLMVTCSGTAVKVV